MIDPTLETLIPMQQAPRHIPGRPHISTLWRWTLRRHAPLAVIRVGGRAFASVEAIERFIRACNADNTVPMGPAMATGGPA